jgi:hypothetical protein
MSCLAKARVRRAAGRELMFELRELMFEFRRHCEEPLRRSNPAFFSQAPKLDCFANARNDDLKPSMTISDYLCSAV